MLPSFLLISLVKLCLCLSAAGGKGIRLLSMISLRVLFSISCTNYMLPRGRGLSCSSGVTSWPECSPFQQGCPRTWDPTKKSSTYPFDSTRYYVLWLGCLPESRQSLVITYKTQWDAILICNGMSNALIQIGLARWSNPQW